MRPAVAGRRGEPSHVVRVIAPAPGQPPTRVEIGAERTGGVTIVVQAAPAPNTSLSWRDGLTIGGGLVQAAAALAAVRLSLNAIRISVALPRTERRARRAEQADARFEAQLVTPFYDDLRRLSGVLNPLFDRYLTHAAKLRETDAKLSEFEAARKAMVREFHRYFVATRGGLLLRIDAFQAQDRPAMREAVRVGLEKIQDEVTNALAVTGGPEAQHADPRTLLEAGSTRVLRTLREQWRVEHPDPEALDADSPSRARGVPGVPATTGGEKGQ